MTASQTTGAHRPALRAPFSGSIPPTTPLRRAARALQIAAVRWLGATCWACEARLAVGEAGPWCPGCAVAVEPGAVDRPMDREEASAEGGGNPELPLAAQWVYAGAVAQALGRAKARGHALPMGVIADEWSTLVHEALRSAGATAVCAVPPQGARLAERGWSLPDQLAVASAAPVVWPLQRVDAQAPRRVDRQAAPEFRSARAPSSAPRLLLIDDVLTTGATLRACRQVLEGQGWQVAAAAVLADARPSAIAEVLGGGG